MSSDNVATIYFRKTLEKSQEKTLIKNHCELGENTMY